MLIRGTNEWKALLGQRETGSKRCTRCLLETTCKVRCKRSTRSLPVVDRESLATIQGHILNRIVSASRTVFTQIVIRGDVRERKIRSVGDRERNIDDRDRGVRVAVGRSNFPSRLR